MVLTKSQRRRRIVNIVMIILAIVGVVGIIMMLVDPSIAGGEDGLYWAVYIICFVISFGFYGYRIYYHFIWAKKHPEEYQKRMQQQAAIEAVEMEELRVLSDYCVYRYGVGIDEYITMVRNGSGSEVLMWTNNIAWTTKIGQMSQREARNTVMDRLKEQLRVDRRYVESDPRIKLQNGRVIIISPELRPTNKNVEIDNTKENQYNEPKDWFCQDCGHSNPGTMTLCEECGMNRR